MKTPSRRAFLRGAGAATLALPWLESVSAGPRSPDGGQPKPPRRVAFYYVPIGVVRRGFFPGETHAGLPEFNGDFSAIIETKTSVGSHPIALTPTLEPLKHVRDKVALVTGLDRTFQIGTDVHAQCASCFLSSAAPFSITTSAWPLDRTLDHVIADGIGGGTPFRTLEVSCNSHRDNLESIYFDNISWYGTGHVAPSIRSPRKLYDRLFGTENLREFQTITDFVLEDARSMRSELGREDRRKFEEYFESVRAIETQLGALDEMRVADPEMDPGEGFVPTAEAGLPRGWYIRIMGDLMISALQTGLTRVATLMVAPERWNTPFLFEGVSDKMLSHHLMSHSQREFGEQLLSVDRFYMQQFAYLVERMDGIEEADGSTLLDNTIFTYGSGLGDGATHQYNDLPIVVAGAGGGRLKPGQHLHCPDGTPLANLWLTQARVAGVELDRFADSTGVVPQLLA